MSYFYIKIIYLSQRAKQIFLSTVLSQFVIKKSDKNKKLKSPLKYQLQLFKRHGNSQLILLLLK